MKGANTGARLVDVMEHLSRRGFVSRLKWHDYLALFFDLDSIAWLSNFKIRTKQEWVSSLDDVKFADWFLVPFYCQSPIDDYSFLWKTTL